MTALVLALWAVLSRPFAPCSHAPDEPAPAWPDAEARAAVKAEIRDVVAELGGSPRLAAYLIVVAARESSLRPGVIHVGDSGLAAAAYRRLRARHIATGHPFARRPDVWLSYGLFGMNSNYHAASVDDPRQLCTTRGAVTAYVLAARSVTRRMRRCVSEPTFGDLHRALQRGKLCPDGRRPGLARHIAGAPIRPGDLG